MTEEVDGGYVAGIMERTHLMRMGKAEDGGGGRTVVVGVKLDSPSRELLTWALVKVAQPGDCVVALHVLGHNEIVDRDGKSSLLSLVKAFESVLAVYEGFCNLKQVDLKLKICRGSSVQKIIVREVESYAASTLIIGVSRKLHKIRWQATLAKHCAKKLPRDCCVIAVKNGKVLFQREASVSGQPGRELRVQKSGSLFALMHQPLSDSAQEQVKDENGRVDDGKNFLCSESEQQEACSICSPTSVLGGDSAGQSIEESSVDGGEEDNSMAIVPVQKCEPAPSSVTLLIKELPELRPGWPLLRRAAVQQGPSTPCSSKISVVQWAMRLPSRRDAEDLSTLPEELVGLAEKFSATCRLFKFQELVAVTSNFERGNLIGRGGSSRVYRGSLPDGKELAVKILKPSEDVLKEFVLEIEIITTLHHKNIAPLVGFCLEDSKLLLVYNFLSRGSLEENLHGDKKDVAFSWSERYKVALGVAEALNYLHNESARPVIHRDVKSSNILLSDDFEPQLSDFGLAKWASTSSSHIICSDVSGTFGYLAPEYFMYGKVNDKIDVYAFGVVLLELLTGRKPIDSDYPKGQESLVMWARPILDAGKISQLLDQSLGSNYDHEQMERMILAANLCVRRTPRPRPNISLVLKLLQGDAEVTNWARLQVNANDESEVLDSAACPRSELQSHLNLALLDVEEDSLSMSSIEGVPLEDYLKGRWSRSSSFE